LNTKILQNLENLNAFSGLNPLKIVNKTLKHINLFGYPYKNYNRYSDIVETLDVYLENVDTNLDKINVIFSLFPLKFFYFLVKKKAATQKNDKNLGGMPLEVNKLGEEMIKPQLKYEINDFDNDISIPFIPKLREKHNALVPLQDIILNAQKEKKANFSNTVKFLINFLKRKFCFLKEEIELPHPYQYEIENLQYNADQLKIDVTCQDYTKYEKENYTLIKDLEGLKVKIKN